MLSSQIIRGMKQSNVSENEEKTKIRFKEVWKDASNYQKQIIRDLSGIANATVYRVYNTGSISAKIVCATAQTLKVNPNYLTGASDERGDYSHEILENFVRDHGYGALLEMEENKARKQLLQPQYTYKPARSAEEEEDEPLQLNVPPAHAGGSVSDAEIEQLLKALCIRARVNASARNRLAEVKRLLMED